MTKFDKIILGIPHSSISGVFDNGSGWKRSAALINAIIAETDWHTDFIFSDDSNDRVIPVVFGKSRFAVDAERLDNDPLESEGRGIFYTDVCGCHRGAIGAKYKSDAYLDRLLYLTNLSDWVAGKSIIIDCHSFGDDSSDVDICIGYNEDDTKPDEETLDAIASVFKESGYRVAFNTPYSNSIAPSVSIPYKSVMIEVNKRLYLKDGIKINTDTLYAPRLTETIKRVYRKLLS